jgi:hypothetical protein
MADVATTADIRAWATALPEVTEKQHFRFHVRDLVRAAWAAQAPRTLVSQQADPPPQRS